MDEIPQKPVFGASNPALSIDHESAKGEILGWLLGCIGVIVVLFFAAGLAANILARKISDKTEVKWFKTIESTIQSQLHIDQDQPPTEVAFQRAKSILIQLKSAQKLRDLPLSLHYSKSTDPNAYAIPGGTIALTKGLLNTVHGDMGLAMVLAHEIGHHQHRDPIRSMGRSLILSLTASLLFGSSTATNYVLGFLNNSYSRDQESKADEFGLRLVFKAFHTTDGALEFFENIAKEHNFSGNKYMSMFSTHPYTPDRLEALKLLASKLQE